MMSAMTARDMRKCKGERVRGMSCPATTWTGRTNQERQKPSWGWGRTRGGRDHVRGRPRDVLSRSLVSP